MSLNYKDFMEGITIFISLISAMIGASLNGVFNRFLAQKQIRHQNTMRVYDEYNAKDMLEARHRASFLLRTNWFSNNRMSMKELKESLPVDEFYNIARVIRFMEKLATLAEHNQIDRKLAVRLLGNDLNNWYEVYLSKYYELEKNDLNNWFPLFRAVDGLLKQEFISKVTLQTLSNKNETITVKNNESLNNLTSE